NQGSLMFLDLRDRYGITQVVLEPERKELLEAAREIRGEFVLSVYGEGTKRLPGKGDKELATGAIEVKAQEFTILNRCPALPFEITEFSDQELANEDLRLQYRFLDLRQMTLQSVLILRHRLCQAIRSHLDKQGFLEVETPLL